ncbi:MAG: hypothetical protein ACYTG6_04885 [Planctomycetota bacterium]|jgi:hypothetical protein
MTRLARFGLFLPVLLLCAPVCAEEPQEGETIAWSHDLPSAFAEAKDWRKILMICINPRHVSGQEREEPAARHLREVTGRDPRVVEKSRAFVCALLTPEGRSEEYGELRGLGITGLIVSPQHIFVHPDGQEILLRKEYWPYGYGERAVEALLAMMDEAQAELTGPGAGPEVPDTPDAPPSDEDVPSGEARAQWIQQKNVEIANHTYRALGRCGAGDAKVRALLLKEAGSAPSEFASYGACIGLAYFEGDRRAARGVEKLLKKIGVPGSRRGGGQNAIKRSLLSWTLASIGDAGSGPFVRDELMSGLEHVQAVWVGGLLAFWELVARVCEGERELLPGVEDGVRGAVSFVKAIDLSRYGAETRNLMDEYRRGREAGGFTPLGDHILNDERR